MHLIYTYNIINFNLLIHIYTVLLYILYIYCLYKQRVRKDEGEELAKEFNIKFFETSAKENIGVKEAFSILSAEVKTRILSADYTEEEYKVDAIRLTGSNKPKDSNHSSCSC